MEFDYEKALKQVYGFLFKRYESKISKSKVLTYYQCKRIPKGKSNKDEVPLFVICHKCNEYMDFVEDCGYFKCATCKRRVKEMTLFAQLGRENESFRFGVDNYEDFWGLN